MQAAIQLCQPLLFSSILPIAGIGHRRIFPDWLDHGYTGQSQASKFYYKQWYMYALNINTFKLKIILILKKSLKK